MEISLSQQSTCHDKTYNIAGMSIKYATENRNDHMSETHSDDHPESEIPINKYINKGNLIKIYIYPNMHFEYKIE